jgi:hypothetical protein
VRAPQPAVRLLAIALAHEVDSVSVDGETVPSTTLTSYVFLPATCDRKLAVGFGLVDGRNVPNVE